MKDYRTTFRQEEEDNVGLFFFFFFSLSFLHYATCRVEQPKGSRFILVLIQLTQFINLTLQTKMHAFYFLFLIIIHIALLQMYDWNWVS